MLHHVFLIILMVFAGQSLSAQSSIFIENKSHEGRIRKLNSDRQYTVFTSDSVYRYHKLGVVNDSTLSLISQTDAPALSIRIKDINYLKKEPKTGVFEVIAYTGAILLSITPVVWAFDGRDEALGTLQGAGLLAAVSVPVIVGKNAFKKKDMINHWTISVNKYN